MHNLIPNAPHENKVTIEEIQANGTAEDLGTFSIGNTKD